MTNRTDRWILRICAIASHVVFSQAHVYLGCGSADFVDVSCATGDATFHVRCAGILLGTIAQKAQQCNALCLSYPDYIAFSIQNSTSCLCKKSMPSVDSNSTEADHCSKSDVVFSLHEELRPSFLLRLERSDQLAVSDMTEGGLSGFQTRSSSTLKQNFFLGRCMHQEAAACLADVNSWKGTDQIKSGDIVAWASQSSGLAYVCNNLDCEEEAFPPHSIAALYRIGKASGNGVAVDGTAINFGDSVYLYSLQFEANVVCDEVRCGVSSPGINAIDNGQFILKKAQEDGILSPNAMIKLFKGGKAATLSGMKYDEEIYSNWFLGKCGSGSIKCPIDYDIMNDGLAAFGTSEQIRSGDIVAWVNQGTGLNHAMNCVDDDIPCIALSHPPEPGFQGAFFKIIKVVNDVPVSPGSVIRFGDEVYFYTLQYLEWDESRYVDCKSNICEATTHSTIPQSKFYILEAARSTCAAYRCPYGHSTNVPNAASTLLTDENCCQLEAIMDLVDSATEDPHWWIVVLCSTTVCCTCCMCCIVLVCKRRKAAKDAKNKADPYVLDEHPLVQERNNQIALADDAQAIYQEDIEVVIDKAYDFEEVGDFEATEDNVQHYDLDALSGLDLTEEDANTSLEECNATFNVDLDNQEYDLDKLSGLEFTGEDDEACIEECNTSLEECDATFNVGIDNVQEYDLDKLIGLELTGEDDEACLEECNTSLEECNATFNVGIDNVQEYDLDKLIGLEFTDEDNEACREDCKVQQYNLDDLSEMEFTDTEPDDADLCIADEFGSDTHSV